MKRISIYWAPVVGLLAVAAQVITFYVRFGRWNADSSVVDYALFFIAGWLGGWILIYFINRQASAAGRWSVLIGFLLATPISLFMMVAGGMLGPVGVVLFPLIPWALFCWLGSLTGRFFPRGVG